MKKEKDTKDTEMKNKKKKNNKSSKKDIDETNNKPKKKKGVVRRILKIILIILLVLIIGGTGYLVYKTQKNGGGMQGFLSTVVGHDQDTLKNMPSIQFVVMGESLNLTDTIMVASYNPKTQEASLISIPRDTFIGKTQSKATAWDKINALYQGKYPEKTVKAINKLLGTELEYYVTIDTKALRELVDVIGGVEFDVPIDMKYDDTSQDLHINLKAGVQVLDGDKAEQLVRFRHNNDGTSYPEEYGDNDIGRMRTQREFITAVLKQTLKPQNILKIGDFLDIANENVKTNIDLSVAKDYVPYAVNFSTESLKTGTLPGEAKKCNGVWLYIHDAKETKVLVEELITNVIVNEEEITGQEDSNTIDNTTTNSTQGNTTISDATQEELKIELLNGSGKSSNLSKVTELLKENGYNVVKTGTTNSTEKTSIVNRTGQSATTISELKKLLGVGSTSTKNSNSNVDFTIIIGKDYK